MASKAPWIVAIVFGVFIVVMIVRMVLFPSPTDPEYTAGKGMMSLQKHGQPLSLVLGADPSGAGNAADYYNQAIAAYQADRDALEEINSRLPDVTRKEYRYSNEELAQLRKVADLVSSGAARAEMSNYSADEIQDARKSEKAERYQELAHVLDSLALHYRVEGAPADVAKAAKCYLDMLVMGRHMVEERARFGIVDRGLGLQAQACTQLAAVYGKHAPNKKDAVEEYNLGLGALIDQYGTLRNEVFYVLRGEWGCPHPGDVINLAGGHPDRAIRVEAIIRLGIVKFGGIERGDVDHVQKLIKKGLASADEFDRAAAKVANEITAEEVRMLGR